MKKNSILESRFTTRAIQNKLALQNVNKNCMLTAKSSRKNIKYIFFYSIKSNNIYSTAYILFLIMKVFMGQFRFQSLVNLNSSILPLSYFLNVFLSPSHKIMESFNYDTFLYTYLLILHPTRATYNKI